MLATSRENDGGVVVWTIDEPASKNALDLPTMEALALAAREAAADASVRAAVVTGRGDVFASGGNLRALRHQTSPADAAEFCDVGWEMTSALAELPFPVVAALPGPAIGGGAELALACDLRVASENARIGFKQVRMGVTTGWGTVPRLAAVVGAGTAARLLFAAVEMTAAEAKSVGLVDEVTPEGGALAVALAWAAEIALGSPTAVARMKALLREALGSAREVRALERRIFVETYSGQDHVDAVEAWFEGRPARWAPRS